MSKDSEKNLVGRNPKNEGRKNVNTDLVIDPKLKLSFFV